MVSPHRKDVVKGPTALQCTRSSVLRYRLEDFRHCFLHQQVHETMLIVIKPGRETQLHQPVDQWQAASKSPAAFAMEDSYSGALEQRLSLSGTHWAVDVTVISLHLTPSHSGHNSAVQSCWPCL